MRTCAKCLKKKVIDIDYGKEDKSTKIISILKKPILKLKKKFI